MKNKLYFAGLLIAILTIMVVACDNGSTGGGGDSFVTTTVFEGTWNGDNSRTLTFTSTSYKIFVTGNESDVKGQGTFKVNNADTPTTFQFTQGNNVWTQAVTLSGTSFVLTKRSDNQMPNTLQGTYTKQ